MAVKLKNLEVSEKVEKATGHHKAVSKHTATDYFSMHFFKLHK